MREALPAGGVHYSKRDDWLAALLLFAAAGLFLAALGIVLGHGPLTLRIVLPPILIAGMILTLWILYTTRYILTATGLRIVSGPFRWWIPFEVIERVTPTRSILAGPACSLDRLEIVRSNSALGVLISPEDKQAFLSDLVSLAPSLHRVGDHVTR